MIGSHLELIIASRCKRCGTDGGVDATSGRAEASGGSELSLPEQDAAIADLTLNTSIGKTNHGHGHPSLQLAFAFV